MKVWLIPALVLLALTGCAENTAGMRVDGETQHVFFHDNVLGNRLLIDDISTVPADDRVRGVVRLTSNYKGDQSILYRFSWYDANGLEVNSKPGPWRQAIVRGGESITLSEVTINPNGTQYRVQIRANND